MTLCPEQLAQALTTWQQRLRLVDWDITAEIKPGTGEEWGSVVTFPEKKRATITLLDPQNVTPAEANNQDHERTLIHELLHIPTLQFYNCEDHDDPKFIMYEQFIHQTSCALVGLARVINEERPPS